MHIVYVVLCKFVMHIKPVWANTPFNSNILEFQPIKLLFNLVQCIKSCID